MILITTAFGVVDLACYGQLRGDIQLGGPLPWQAVVAIFLALSVRSRVFSPLDNSRPELRAGRVSAEEDVELEAKLNAAKGKTRIKDLQGACEQRGLAFNAAMDRTELERRLRGRGTDSEEVILRRLRDAAQHGPVQRGHLGRGLVVRTARVKSHWRPFWSEWRSRGRSGARALCGY
jgi:hypothetical protein